MIPKAPPPSRPLRVVMLIPYDPFYQPFVIRSIRFAEELVRRGHEVRFFYPPMQPGQRGNKVREAMPEGVVATSVRPWSREGVETLDRAIAEADVVHFQKSKPPMSWLALSLAARHDKPVHQDWDDDEFAFWVQATRDRLGAVSVRAPEGAVVTAKAAVMASLTGATEYLIPRLVDTVGGATMSLRRKSERWGAAPGAIFPAAVGVDVDTFAPTRRDEALRAQLRLDGPTVLYAGSFDVRPDLDFFVEVLRALFAEAPETRCLVVGGGFGREIFRTAIAGASIADRVRMTEGLVPFAEMPRYVASCDVAALPFRDNDVNRSKSSLTLLECMASGLPCVTHDVGDIGWMMGGGGVVAPLDDAAAFAHRLATLLRDPEARRKLGDEGRRRATTAFPWSRSVDYLEAAYARAIELHRLGRRAEAATLGATR